jgi:branched-chain amino acid transport system ATP-binding protein
MLEVKNLMVFFENGLAINNLNIKVMRGEIVGVFGSNNAGKTTLMNAISGLLLDMKKKEDRIGGIRITLLGEIFYEGENITWLPPWERVKRGLVVARERHPIFPESTVEENLKIASYISPGKMKERLELVYTIFPPLKKIRKRPAGFCSGGEQQMLIIGMVLMTSPKLLLLDEPLLGLAPAIQKDLVRAIDNIRKEGITILVAEQFARPLFPIIDRGYIIENGVLTLEGSKHELMNNPDVKSAYFGV